MLLWSELKVIEKGLETPTQEVSEDWVGVWGSLGKEFSGDVMEI